MQQRLTQLIREGELIGTAAIRVRREFGLPVTGPHRAFEVMASVQRDHEQRAEREARRRTNG